MKNIYDLIQTNDIENIYADIIYILIKKNNLYKYIKNIYKEDLNNSYGIYTEDKNIYINKYIKEILYYKYQNLNIKNIMTKEDYININILLTLVHETHHAIQEKRIKEQNDVKTIVLKDTRLIKPTQVFYKIDPNEKDAFMNSYSFIIDYLISNNYDKKTIEYFSNIYNNQITPCGYIEKNLEKGTLQMVYEIYLNNLKKYKNMQEELDNIKIFDKLTINHSIKRR